MIADLPGWLLRLLRPPVTLPPLAPRRRDFGDAYVVAAFDQEVAAVANAVEGTRNHQLNESAFRLGTLVGAGKLDAQEVGHALLDAALRCGLGQREAEATILSGLRAGARNPRTRR